MTSEESTLPKNFCIICGIGTAISAVALGVIATVAVIYQPVKVEGSCIAYDQLSTDYDCNISQRTVCNALTFDKDITCNRYGTTFTGFSGMSAPDFLSGLSLATRLVDSAVCAPHGVVAGSCCRTYNSPEFQICRARAIRNMLFQEGVDARVCMLNSADQDRYQNDSRCSIFMTDFNDNCDSFLLGLSFSHSFDLSHCTL